jgi:hypothetical protein
VRSSACKVFSEAALMLSAGTEQSACQLTWEEGEEGLMRFMITCLIPVEEGNESANASSLGSTIQSIMEELKPEAAFFFDIDGVRGGYIVVNMDEASQISAIAETLFVGLGATIEVHRVMTPEELSQATSAIEQASQKKYG